MMPKRRTIIALLSLYLMAVTTSGWAVDDNHYVITLTSSLTAFTDDDYPSTDIRKTHPVYITRVVINNRLWYRMNLGFFSTRAEATMVLKKLIRDKRFSDAWIRKAAENEYRDNMRSNVPKPVIRSIPKPVTTLAPAQTQTALIHEAPEKPIKPRDQVKWSGSFSQFSSREILTYDNGTTENVNVLINNLGTEGRYEDESIGMRTYFDSTYRNTIYDDNSIDNEWRLSSLHLALNFKKANTDLIMGRQFANSGGILGRFDGIWWSQRLGPRWRYSLYAGYPVDLYNILPIDETDRHFAGISLDMGRFADTWDFNLFGISQQINGIVDRQAVGGEIRFSNRKRSHFLLLDYDVSYNTINTAVLSSNWVLPARFTFNLLLDTRTIPTLATSSALWGRSESGIDELLAIMTEEEVRQLARDRTTRGKTITVGLSRPIANNYQLSMELTRFHQTDMVASGGVDAIEYGGIQNIAKLTFLGSGMFKPGDLTIISLRHTGNDFSSTNSFDMNIRYPLTRAWRAGPTLLIERADNRISFDTLIIKPSLGIDYRWLSNITFDASLMLVHTNVLDPAGSDSSNVYFKLGYRYDF